MAVGQTSHIEGTGGRDFAVTGMKTPRLIVDVMSSQRVTNQLDPLAFSTAAFAGTTHPDVPNRPLLATNFRKTGIECLAADDASVSNVQM